MDVGKGEEVESSLDGDKEVSDSLSEVAPDGLSEGEVLTKNDFSFITYFFEESELNPEKIAWMAANSASNFLLNELSIDSIEEPLSQRYCSLLMLVANYLLIMIVVVMDLKSKLSPKLSLLVEL